MEIIMMKNGDPIPAADVAEPAAEVRLKWLVPQVRRVAAAAAENQVRGHTDASERLS
jgi:hypothetical protein